jgi:hypothetical protein
MALKCHPCRYLILPYLEKGMLTTESHTTESQLLSGLGINLMLLSKTPVPKVSACCH